MTKFPDLFERLAAPFASDEVKVFSKNNKQIHYTTARTVMNRLDTVLGPESWWDEYTPHENSVLCRLTVRLPDGSTLTKCDAGGYAGMADSGDDDKSGYSDAFKRAAVKFGVARYLYRDGVPCYAALDNPSPPLDVLPSQAVPSRTAPAPADLGWVHGGTDRPAPQAIANGRMGKPVVTVDAPAIPAPKTGGQLYKWAKVQEEQQGVGLIKYLTQWGKLQSFAARIVDWSPEWVALGLAEAERKLAAIAPRGEAYDGEPSVN